MTLSQQHRGASHQGVCEKDTQKREGTEASTIRRRETTLEWGECRGDGQRTKDRDRKARQGKDRLTKQHEATKAKGNKEAKGAGDRLVAGRAHWKTGQIVNACRTRRDGDISPRMKRCVGTCDC